MKTAQKLVAAVAELGVEELTGGAFEANDKWPVLQRLAIPMAVRIPLERITLREVRKLAAGCVLTSEWPAAEEVPLFAADVALSWCEFAVIDGVMAARLTRLG
ncbi:MAG: FliM/FliN family flagellar motor C-terminal domain-containing protein [Acidobacteriaceae bacterium]|nr:FliM/FliN family flagellar motor C-terminal domain-containing protein [Acidobacteriaceae bacterium]